MFSAAAFLTYILITAITPGPNNIMSMTHASQLGIRRSFPFNLGILSGFLVVMSLCTLFSSLLFSVLPRVRLVMQVLGGVYMLYLAYKTFVSKPPQEASASKSGYLSGMLLQFVNPKIYLYCITAMSSYILPHFSGFWPLAGFVVLLSMVGFLATLCWALFGSAFHHWFTGKSRVLNTVMALLLVYCAISLFF
ncbi:LysE family transporter [Eubacteriales bacterium OttesenSCG-928-A19]|nr:LysE family transporter [Eubacteriales bacterium OttesenSCG-928-A19]